MLGKNNYEQFTIFLSWGDGNLKINQQGRDKTNNYTWELADLSLARRFANSDIPTGPTLAACGDAIALKVAFTAPLSAAV